MSLIQHVMLFSQLCALNMVQIQLLLNVLLQFTWQYVLVASFGEEGIYYCYENLDLRISLYVT